MNKPKIVFFDVDNTLVSHTMHDIPASTLEAMYKMQDMGIKVFLSTGRHVCEFDDLPMHNFPFDGYVLLTGQFCMDKNFNILYHNPMPIEDQEELVKIFNEKEVAILMVNKEDYYLNIVNQNVKDVQTQIESVIPNVKAYQNEPIYQASIYSNPETAQKVIARLPHCKLSAWNQSGYDIVSTIGGKDTGIQKICDYYNINVKETMAFGDADNDIDMLKLCGIGICMGNGTKEAKEAADFVTKHIDEDGVYFALQHYGILD